MKKEETVCIVMTLARGKEYLCGYESCLYGEVYLPYTSQKASQALPMSREMAEFLLGKFDFDIRKYFSIFPYPRKDLPISFFDLPFEQE